MVKEQQKEELFFVQIQEPNEVKRSILESLRDIVESLHRFERFKSARDGKLAIINRLRAQVREINKLISRLKELLPEAKLRGAKPALKEVRVLRKDVRKSQRNIEPKPA